MVKTAMTCRTLHNIKTAKGKESKARIQDLGGVILISSGGIVSIDIIVIDQYPDSFIKILSFRDLFQSTWY